MNYVPVRLTSEEVAALRFLASRVQCFDGLLGVDLVMRTVILQALDKLREAVDRDQLRREVRKPLPFEEVAG